MTSLKQVHCNLISDPTQSMVGISSSKKIQRIYRGVFIQYAESHVYRKSVSVQLKRTPRNSLQKLRLQEQKNREISMLKSGMTKIEPPKPNNQ